MEWNEIKVFYKEEINAEEMFRISPNGLMYNAIPVLIRVLFSC